MIGKKQKKKNKKVIITLNVLHAKNEDHIQFMFQNITQILKNK